MENCKDKNDGWITLDRDTEIPDGIHLIKRANGDISVAVWHPNLSDYWVCNEESDVQIVAYQPINYSKLHLLT